jgi:hypothetical protein
MTFRICNRPTSLQSDRKIKVNSGRILREDLDFNTFHLCHHGLLTNLCGQFYIFTEYEIIGGVLDEVEDQRSVVLPVNSVGNHSIDNRLNFPENFPGMRWQNNLTIRV